MTDDTTLTNPSVPKHEYGTSPSDEDYLLTDFTQVASGIFNENNENHQARKIRADLVRDYIAKSDSESTSVFQKIIHFLQG